MSRSACLQALEKSLISRGFESFTNGHKAERESNDAASVNASLWARDELCGILSGVDSSNCVIALCSLVAVIAEFDERLNFKERLIMDQNKNYISHSSWHKRALTSLLQLLKGVPVDDVYFADLLGVNSTMFFPYLVYVVPRFSRDFVRIHEF